MSLPEYRLQPSSPDQRKTCPTHVLSAVPCVGVFTSDADFIDYLRYFEAQRCGDLLYCGHVDRPLLPPLRIYAMNYTLQPGPGSRSRPLTVDELGPGTMAVITAGAATGHVVLGTCRGVIDLTEPAVSVTEGALVRLFAAGEELVVRGR